MDVKRIISAVRREFQKHSWDTFVDEPPAISHGGKGVVVPGCPACKIRINTMNVFMEHVEEKVTAVIVRSCSGRSEG